MGFWKTIKGPFKRSKKVRVVSSAIVSGAVGFFMGGPPGMIAYAMVGISASIANDSSFVIGTSFDLGPRNICTEENIDVQYQSESIFNEQKDSEEESWIIMWLKNAKEKNTFGWKTIEWISKILKKGEDYQEFVDKNKGPKFPILETDPQNIAFLKTRANNIVDDIEKKCGNYSDLHTPLNDIFNGFELKNILKQIQDFYDEEEKCEMCVICNGTGKTLNTTCPSCGGCGKMYY